eukprot:TRINITY_DN42154_c0_g1_i1.p1 TRINITY_DN42154_c0_g1~~TRINITY_DN42154_c0_g1_i1.p1  ORF type:complete len:742 (-),score=142.44 TRINITY_DN42154_c0_g1_i1:75-2300(-)
MADDELPDEDTLRILVATDTHVGYNEKDKLRGLDALNTFEEALQIGKSKKADLILHGGDLFHDNKPSRGCIYKTMELLRQYTMGSGEVYFQVVSDQSMFSRGAVNYEDPNLNVELPFFMIHGNHDDPGGESNLCAASLLEVAGLCNYFGRSEDLEDIVVRPLLIRKGQSQVAIYGLGNIRDERLNRAFQARKVRFETPSDPSQWFHVMILHQNRHKGNKGGVPSKSCIHEEMLPSFLDLVIWGHEHDCEVKPQESLRGEFYVVQPGSSVATSLTPGETGLKHVAVIDLRRGVFRCNPVPLWTVRPLVMRDMVLSETGLLKTDTQAIWNALTSEVDSMIAQGEEEVQRRRRELEARGRAGPRALEVPRIPLVRLRVEHSGYETISGQTFGQQFSGRIANPDEVLLFHRRSGGAGGAVASRKVQGIGDILEIEEGPVGSDDGSKIQDIIYKYIDGEQNLQILSEPDLNDAVQSFVHRAEPCAIEKFVKQAVESTNEAVLKESRAVGEEEIRVQIQDRAESLRQARLTAAAQNGDLPAGSLRGAEAAQAKPEVDLLGEVDVPASASQARAAPTEDFLPSTASARNSVEAPASLPAPGRGRGPGSRGGRGSRGGGRGRGRGAKRSQEDLEDAGLAAPAPAPAPAAKITKTQARAQGAGGDSQRGVRDFFSGGASAAGGTVQTAVPTVPPPTEATPFLPRRAAATAPAADTLWGEGAPVASVAADTAAGTSQPAPPRRQWALRTPG